ncbi:MAG: DUF2147 domain-containing protein [Bacteroidales bacterium]|jgi:uncharacterized protein (DUF2147 family)|nr:DUF2147 domain-containing protein [Bacteroidales bacterium]MBO7306008.1 DUF2147 domain-containing protein [Bacteroidales bacterium]MBQ1218376.1 DUF2147 domain-containing protein [Bacteroidales bacterium]
MKRFIALFIALVGFSFTSIAQDINNNPDSIIGEYLADRGGSKSKVRVTKNADGTYTAQVFWVEHPLDKNGNKRKDTKNPDKTLRNVDIDKVVLVKGLQYIAEDKEWGGTKIYDPTKGIRVNVSAKFETPDKLKLRGTILGIGVTIYWNRIK